LFSFFLAGLASVTMFGIVVTLMGLFIAAGSQLDIVRAMVYTMNVGLSVDYVVGVRSFFFVSGVVAGLSIGISSDFEPLALLCRGLVGRQKTQEIGKDAWVLPIDFPHAHTHTHTLTDTHTHTLTHTHCTDILTDAH
jgi:hypothetical protein